MERPARAIRAGRFVSGERAVGSAPVTTSPSEREGWALQHGPLIAAVLFFAAGLVWLGSSAHFHGDERYYTDSALRMLEHGDPWTPMWADGTVRANKPLVTYWVLIASFTLCGISFLAARLPFLLAGALLVWLTGRLARTLFPNQRAAPLVAALIVACDYEVVSLARRSTPDILLMLFTTAALYGLARIVVAQERSQSARAWFWIGGAFAIATKGGLGVLVLAFGTIAFLALRRGRPLRDLLSLPSLAGAALVIAIGFVPSLLLQSQPGSPSFADDQVAARLAGSVSEIGAQLVDYATSLAKHFLPWILFLAIGAFATRTAFREQWRAHRTAFVLALSFAALLWILFSLSNTHRGRYLAPAHALLAAAVAPLLIETSRAPWGRRLGWALAAVLLTITTAGAVLVARIDVGTGVQWLAPLALFVIGLRIVRDEAAVLRGLALALLGVVTIAQESLLALVDPSPLPLVVEEIAAHAPPPRRVATLGFAESTAGQLRMVSHGAIDPVYLRDKATDDELTRFDLVIASEPEHERLTRLGYAITPVARTPRNLDARSARALFLGGEDLANTVFTGPACGVARRR